MLARCVPEDKYFATIDLMFRRQAIWMKGDKAAELLKVTQMAGMDKAGFVRQNNEPAHDGGL